jgi:hypothetical protein
MFPPENYLIGIGLSAATAAAAGTQEPIRFQIGLPSGDRRERHSARRRVPTVTVNTLLVEIDPYAMADRIVATPFSE